MRKFLVLFAFALLAPFAAATPSSLIAGAVTAEDAMLEGRLDSMTSRDRSDAPGPAFGSFDLTAGKVHLEGDHEYRNTTLVGATLLPPETFTSRQVFHEAVIHSVETGERPYIFLEGFDAEVHGAGGFQVEQERNLISQHRWVLNDREPLSSSSETARIQATAPTTITVEGSFVLAVWDWDLSYEAAEGEGTVHSGEDRSSTGGVVEDRHLRQVYLFVEDGVARFTVDRPDDLVAFVTDATLASTTRLTMDGATGSLHGHELVDDRVELIGTSSASLRPGERGLAVQVAEDADTMLLGGRAIPLQEPPGADLSMLLLVVPLLGYAAVRGGHRLLVDRAAAYLDKGDFVLSWRFAHLVRFGRHRADAATIAATSALRLGNAPGAANAIGRIKGKSGDVLAMKEYLQGHLCSMQGDLEEAYRHLVAAVELDANLERDVAIVLSHQEGKSRDRTPAYA